MLPGSLRQVSSRGEQCGSVLLAHKGIGRSQPADSLGSRATPWCLAFPPPLHLQVLSVSGQELFPGGHKQTMSSVACLGFLEWDGLGELHILLCAWQRVRLSSVPQQAALVAGLGNIIFQLQAGPWRPALTGCRAVVLGLPWLPWKAG